MGKRISAEIRIATNKRGGTIAHPGAVSFNFDRKGVMYVPKKNAIAEELFDAITNAGAEDFSEETESYIVTCAPQDLLSVKEAIAHLGFECKDASIEWLPKSSVECDPENIKANLALMEWLENIEDVDAVYHNMKIPEES